MALVYTFGYNFEFCSKNDNNSKNDHGEPIRYIHYIYLTDIICFYRLFIGVDIY